MCLFLLEEAGYKRHRREERKSGDSVGVASLLLLRAYHASFAAVATCEVLSVGTSIVPSNLARAELISLYSLSTPFT